MQTFFMPVDQFISKYIHNLKLRRLLAYMNVLYAGDCRVTPAYLHAVIAVLLQKGSAGSKEEHIVLLKSWFVLFRHMGVRL